MARTNYISNKMTDRFLSSVAMSIIFGQFSLFLKPVVAGHFLGGSAIAVISLANPVIELLFAVIVLLEVGASYLVTECISVNDNESANRHFTVSAISSMVSLTVLGALLFAFRAPISIFLCGVHPEMESELEQYLSLISWSGIPLGLFNLFVYNLEADGQIRLSVILNFIVSLADLMFSIAFLSLFKLGIDSFSSSFIASLIIGIITCLLTMRSRFPLHLVPLKPYFSQTFRKNIQKGAPLLMEDLIYIVSILTINLIIVNRIGGNGVVVWGIAVSFITLSSIFLTVGSQSSIVLGQEMKATRDYFGLLQILDRHRAVILLLTVSVLAFVDFCPKMVMAIFGQSEINDAHSINALRMMVSIVVIMSSCMFEVTCCYILNHYKKYIALMAAFYCGPALLLFVFSLIRPEQSCWAFPASAIVCIIVSVIINKSTTLEIRKMEKDNVSLEMSVPYYNSAIGPAMKSVKSFLLDHGAGIKSADAIEHCVDELLYNIIKHTPERINGKTLDLRAVLMDDGITVLFKYDGKPFNPICTFHDNAVDAMKKGDKLKLAQRIFNHYAIKPYYHYGSGINTISMTLSDCETDLLHSPFCHSLYTIGET